MKNLDGQIAFDSDSLPRHNNRPLNPRGRLAHFAMSGSISYENERASIHLKGSPSFAGAFSAESVARGILEEYLANGIAVLTDIRGSFALAISQNNTAKCLIAIDRMGVERLTWGRSNGWLAVSTSASDAARSLAAKSTLNQQALFSFMYSHMVPAPETVFQNVRKLLPGTAIEFTADGQREINYWKPSFERDENVDVNKLLEETRPVLRRAIERTNPGQTSGAFLSGGLDSSTVSGLLADVEKKQTKTFSVGFGVDEYDEMEFARTAAKRFDLAHYIYEVTPQDIVETIPKIAEAYDEPFGNSSAVPTFCCARFAREHGVDHLLAGDGGDEIFGGNERYVRHRIFEYYRRVPAWLKNALFNPLANRIDPETGIFPLRKLSSYVQQAKIPLPERYESWNLIYREGAERIFAGDFLSEVKPRQIFEEMLDVWESCPSNDLLDRMLWYDWKFTLADNDLRKVSRMCELAGVRVSFPMLDEEFVEHSMKVPSRAKIKGHELRTFFKHSVRGFVPDMVINKEKHGFGLPFGVWLKEHQPLQDLVYGSLDSLRHRGIFSPAFLDRVVSEHKDGHASYYGYAIWDLVMLEQWLQFHAP